MPQTNQLTMGVISGAIGALLPIIGAAFYFGGLDENVKAIGNSMSTLDGRVNKLENAPKKDFSPQINSLNERVEAAATKAELRALSQSRPAGKSLERGAVVAFDRDDLTEDTCPEGWSPFLRGRARMIVGAGDPSKSQLKLSFDENGKPLSGYVHRQHGGEEAVTLTIKKMPKHGHSFAGTGIEMGGKNMQSYNDKNKPAMGTDQNKGKLIPEGTISETGGDQPHNNMPPFIALYYCKKN